MELSTNSPTSFLPPPSPALLQPPARQRQFHPQTMEESEKLTALKKAYAEIILNTTKEAAVRIMESERKAARFQQELSSVKEESLRMLIRMKQMLDAKNNEATVVCMSQQQKIEELEAQLNEAEDIVKELREELTEVQAELEQRKTAQCQAEQRGELVAVSDARTFSSYGTYKGTTDCSTGNSCKGYCYCPNPDFASIMRRCKEPKLHKNGCTQRIRACEDNSCKEVQEETCKRGNEGGDQLLGMAKQGYGNMFGDVHFEVARSNKKRKRSTRHSQSKAASFVDHLNHTKETQNPCSRTSQDEDTTFLQSGNTDNFLESQINQVVRNPLKKDCGERTASFMKCQDHGEETQYPSCSKDSLDEDKAFVASQWSDNAKGFLESQVDGDGNEPRDASRLAHYTADSINLEGSLLNSDLKALDNDDGIASQSPDGKFLKYTFQRKRKKEVSCSPDPSCCVEEKNAKNNMVEKHNGSLEPKSLSFTNELSRDSRGLVQVARQLISLSEKTWGQ